MLKRGGNMTEATENPFASLHYSNVYLTILALFCFKLFIKISLNCLSYFYIIRGNRKEAARISAEFYDFGQGHRSWADRSPLHDAACQGRLFALRNLLLQGHNVNVVTIDHVSPLHEACFGDHVACARALIAAGANVNVTTIDGVTPLFNACSVGSVSCAEVLLENGAKPEALVFQPSPIHEASSKGSSECVETLVRWGADVDFEIPHLGTPLYTACVSQEIECVRRLLREGANVQKGIYMESPLHAAAEKDCTAIVKLLLDFGADINARNMEFQRPVEAAPPSSLTEGFLLVYEATPQPLSQLCRQRIRDCVGRDRFHLINHLPLPNPLKNYLQYR
ncbi:ankyrin repeat and SOCS box protein 5-like [Oncorhynchus nerka]|uniref:ankyrin repeat and SOCS box protein 5-like n=1 Tax=Oncorhynchus nerka TaxID=8023 RepID=UPI00112FDD84|nr:ankyrin repeat and SOCS box protein 5-like [Oncorhynchus nerka]XP_046180948.1 ankyrin repeat and SOCS box protein 5-like [Oncorhynchus gorbuscha]